MYFAQTASYGQADFSFDALSLILCTPTHPAGDKLYLSVMVKILCFHVLTYH